MAGSCPFAGQYLAVTRHFLFGGWGGVESILVCSTSHYTRCGLNCCITECYMVCSVGLHTTLTLHHITLFTIGLLGKQSRIVLSPECSVV